MRIAIDLMGGDLPPQELFRGVVQAAALLPSSITLTVLATPAVIEAIRGQAPKEIEFHAAKEFIDSTEDPLDALRKKKQSSIAVGMRLLKKKAIQALVSAGSTGALIASATLTLTKFPGVRRPALLAFLPTEKGLVAIVDVGGNVSYRAAHLVQFALIGSAYIRGLLGIEMPRVGLLNIGSESKKGTKEVREAYRLLSEHCQNLVARGITPSMHFLGNVEGRDVFAGQVDVLVTDGFTGNVLLKTAEGTAAFILNSLQKMLASEPSEAIDRTLRQLQKQFHYAEYPGALICGVEGVVIKCHGHSSPQAIQNGIKGAADLLQKGIPSQVLELIGA